MKTEQFSHDLAYADDVYALLQRREVSTNVLTEIVFCTCCFPWKLINSTARHSMGRTSESWKLEWSGWGFWSPGLVSNIHSFSENNDGFVGDGYIVKEMKYCSSGLVDADTVDLRQLNGWLMPFFMKWFLEFFTK